MGPPKPIRRASARSLRSRRRREARLRSTYTLYHQYNPPSRAALSPPLAPSPPLGAPASLGPSCPSGPDSARAVRPTRSATIAGVSAWRTTTASSQDTGRPSRSRCTASARYPDSCCRGRRVGRGLEVGGLGLEVTDLVLCAPLVALAALLERLVLLLDDDQVVYRSRKLVNALLPA